jgi:hypothetical protein
LILQEFPALSEGGDSSDGTFPKSQEFTAQQIFSSGQSEFLRQGQKGGKPRVNEQATRAQSWQRLTRDGAQKIGG